MYCTVRLIIASSGVRNLFPLRIFLTFVQRMCEDDDIPTHLHEEKFPELSWTLWNGMECAESSLGPFFQIGFLMSDVNPFCANMSRFNPCPCISPCLRPCPGPCPYSYPCPFPHPCPRNIDKDSCTCSFPRPCPLDMERIVTRKRTWTFRFRERFHPISKYDTNNSHTIRITKALSSFMSAFINRVHCP